ncbi:hypothetical protein PGT21_005900 [Puccinia graminis f. sp. tritici]|uniref:Uncharacterized protein n=1 Tax=Puccinia graminis f. sp. tritici TaxID=56615 RepID=A0A5B0LPV6_PUCGR|nr:hypothetical protein PGT21_005900 [Puccinia graminis f. sp. tritici]
MLKHKTPRRDHTLSKKSFTAYDPESMTVSQASKVSVRGVIVHSDKAFGKTGSRPLVTNSSIPIGNSREVVSRSKPIKTSVPDGHGVSSDWTERTVSLFPTGARHRAQIAAGDLDNLDLADTARVLRAVSLKFGGSWCIKSCQSSLTQSTIRQLNEFIVTAILKHARYLGLKLTIATNARALSLSQYSYLKSDKTSGCSLQSTRTAFSDDSSSLAASFAGLGRVRSRRTHNSV